jgi:lipoprotein-anchoring transpeptidase ErfK/SrfK
MQRLVVSTLAALILGTMPVLAGPLLVNPDRYANSASRSAAARSLPEQPAGQAMPERHVHAQPLAMGGGFIEAIFGGLAQPPSRYSARPIYARGEPAGYSESLRPAVDPRFLPQVVEYDGGEKPGTIIIDTPQRFLFLIQPGGKAIRYGIGVGRPGFAWAGVKQVSAKREWPDWRPPEQMLQRRPDLPHYMAGGPDNPLGARALYLGSSLYRIHGSNEPWTIGQAVSSGCIRMRNEDVIDLYDRVGVGAKVVVI